MPTLVVGMLFPSLAHNMHGHGISMILEGYSP
jgi:hypothetical protein